MRNRTGKPRTRTMGRSQVRSTSWPPGCLAVPAVGVAVIVVMIVAVGIMCVVSVAWYAADGVLGCEFELEGELLSLVEGSPGALRIVENVVGDEALAVNDPVRQTVSPLKRGFPPAHAAFGPIVVLGSEFTIKF